MASERKVVVVKDTKPFGGSSRGPQSKAVSEELVGVVKSNAVWLRSI